MDNNDSFLAGTASPLYVVRHTPFILFNLAHSQVITHTSRSSNFLVYKIRWHYDERIWVHYVSFSDCSQHIDSACANNYPNLLHCPNGISLFHNLMGSWEECFPAAAICIHTVPIFVTPGTYYCWLDRCDVDSKLFRNCRNQTPNILISDPMPLPFGHRILQCNNIYTRQKPW